MTPSRGLVTGGAGFIASHLVDALVERGFHVAVVDDLSSGHREFVNPGAAFYQVDIRDASALARVFEVERPDFVDHHAAQISVVRSVADPVYDAQVNILGSLNVLEMARKYKVKKLVFASTGGALYGEPKKLPCDEEHPIAPLSNYGVAKRAVELYIHVYNQAFGLNYTVLRYANVYGPRQDPLGEAGVVAIFSQRMLKGSLCTIFGSGEQERDFVYVGDIVQANLFALEKGDLGKFNIGSGRGTSVNSIFSLLQGLTSYSKNAEYAPARAGEVSRIYLDNSLARNVLGWRPGVSLEDGLRRTVEYFKSPGRA